MFVTAPTLTAILLAFVPKTSVPASSSQAPAPFRATCYVGGKWYVAEYTEEMATTPQWDEDAESPPLSPRKAIRLATKMKESFFEDHDSFKFRSLTLTQVGEGWVWLVLFAPSITAGHGARFEFPPLIHLIVLMDGQVLKPVESETPYGVIVNPEETPKKDTSGDDEKTPDSK